MKPPRFRYLRAESVDGALRALADNPDAVRSRAARA